jgi:hypothetical protein
VNLTGLHILLTYQCNFQCDHCFVWGSPWQTGTFTLPDLVRSLEQAEEVKSVHQIYFEGGEAFLYYPILVTGVEHAHAHGFQTGVVSNGYWATTLADAYAWLEPLAEAGLDRLEISCDLLHGDESGTPKAEFALTAARRLGLKADTITIDLPTGSRDPAGSNPGEPVSGGGLMFRGRAAEKLVAGVPLQPWDSLTACPYEDLANPARVHLDPYGNLHLCQGLLLGNLFQQPLPQILSGYQPARHPIAGPLLVGGPAQLVRTYELECQAGYADACHLCYSSRQALRPRFPDWLAPNQMYGVPGASA